MRAEKMCTVDGCSNPFSAKGYCRAHYQRWKKSGSTQAQTKIKSRSSDVSRFFNITIDTFDADDCLIWPFARTPDGYAIVRFNGKTGIVSRFICERYNGPALSDDLQAAHSCGNGHLGCVNRKHLSWKTPAENTEDRILYGRRMLGADSSRAKLTPADVTEIWTLRSVFTQAEIARKFGVSQSAISNIFYRKTWTDRDYAARSRGVGSQEQMNEDGDCVSSMAR